MIRGFPITDQQLSFSSFDDTANKKTTKREVFLGEMSAVVPWVEIEAVIEQYFPKMGPEGGRRAFPLTVMVPRSSTCSGY